MRKINLGLECWKGHSVLYLYEGQPCSKTLGVATGHSLSLAGPLVAVKMIEARKLQHSLTSLHRKYNKAELKRRLQDYMQERKNRELKRVKKRWIYRIQACCRGGRRPCTCSQPCQRLSRGETIRIHESNAIFKSYDSALCKLIGGECVADMSVGEILVIGRAQGTQIEWLMVLNSRS